MTVPITSSVYEYTQVLAYSLNTKTSKWVSGAARLFWFFGDFGCGALLFMVIHVIYEYGGG